MLARTKQKVCKENMGSLVAQLKVDMMENEGSKTRQLVLKRIPLFQRHGLAIKDGTWQQKTIYFQFSNAIKVVHTDCKSIKYNK